MVGLEEKMNIKHNLLKLICSTTTLLLVLSCSHRPPLVEKKFATDAHLHIHTSQGNDDMQFTGDRALLAINSIDLNRGILLSMGYHKGVTPEKTRKENSYVAQEVKKNPHLFSGGCAINPMVSWSLQEIALCHEEGLKLIKLHTVASGMNLNIKKDLDQLKIILAEAQTKQKTVLIHGHFFNKIKDQENEANILLRTLELYPELKIIIGHLLGRDFALLQNFKHQKFLVEISALPFFVKNNEQKADLVKLIHQVGIEKFIFGSDWPVLHPAEMLKSLKELPLTENEINQIAYTNAQALNYLFE